MLSPKLRKTVSLTTLLSFAALTITGLVLYIVPQGRVAYWAGWTLWGLSKTTWTGVHINLALLFLGATALHLWLNWKPLLSYLKNRTSDFSIATPEFGLATALTLFVFAGTLGGLPPLSWIINVNEAIKVRHEKLYGAPPYGHAELSSLASFAKKTGLDAETALSVLKASGFVIKDSRETLAAIATANGTTPQGVYELIRHKATLPGQAEESALPPISGLGRKTLKEVAAMGYFNMEKAVEALRSRGMNARETSTFREAANAMGMEPMDVLETLKAM